MKLNRNKMAMLMIAIMVTSVVMPMASAQVTALDDPPEQPMTVEGDVTYENGSRVPDGWLVTLTDVTNGTELGNDTTADKIPAIPLYSIFPVALDLVVEGHVIETSVSNDGWSGNMTHTVESGDIVEGGTITMDDIVVSEGPSPGPTIVSYTISNSTITPPQTTEIDVEFSETVSYTIAIESETSTVYDWTGDAKNPEAKVWNGTYKADGTVVPAGNYTVNVTGTNATTGQSVTDTSKVIKVEGDEDYGVDLSVNTPGQTVKPNETATYTLTVKNTGAVMDNYTLDIVNENNATIVSLSKDAIANLGAGESEDVLLNVSDESEDTFVVKVTATSEGDLNVSDSITTTTTVGGEDYGVDLSVNTPGQTVKPNETATYTLTVKNTGAVMDNYTLDIVNENNATIVSLSKDAIANLGAGASEDVLLNVSDASEDTFVVKVTATSEGDLNVSDSITTTTIVQKIELTIANLEADPSTYVNTANPTTVSATITSGAPLELITLFAIDTQNHQPKDYMLYAELIEPIIGGDNYSAKWDATEFEVKGETTSSGTKPVFVIKADEFETIQIPEYVVVGNITINTTTEPEFALALFGDDYKLAAIITEINASLFVPGTTTFTPFAVDATDRAEMSGTSDLLDNFEDLEPVTLTGAEPDYGISLVKTQVLNGEYVVGMGAEDEAGDEDDDETTVSVGPKPTPTPKPTPQPIRRGGGGGGGGGVSDSDGDGYSDIDELITGSDPYDPCDPNPACVACIGEAIIGKVITTPEPTPYDPTKGITPATAKPVATIPPLEEPEKPEKPEKPGVPGFEAVFAIAGLLAVAYLVQRRKK
jgi:PGF-CTERM protein